MTEIKIQKADNGYIVQGPFPYCSYTNGKVVFTSFEELIEFLKKALND